MVAGSAKVDAGTGVRGWQTRRLLLVGFGGLLLLVAFTGLNAVSVLSRIESRNQRIREDYVNRERILEQLRSGLYLSGTYVRDLLLDPDPARARVHRAEFESTRNEVEELLGAYRRILRTEEQSPFHQFTAELAEYFDSLAPALTWNPEQRRTYGYSFMNTSLLPRRSTVVHMTEQISRLNRQQLEIGNRLVSLLFSQFRSNLLSFMGLMLLGGAALAAGDFYRIIRLENQSAVHLQEAVTARAALRDLSARLVEAQEAERRALSRELHDEVGQSVSALLLAIGNVAAAITPDRIDAAKEELQAIRGLAEKTVAVVRDMSLLLRPSMLDDLGLIPALEWQAREVSRNHNIQVTIKSPELGEEVPDEQRTCVYRVVQEALRNVVRHAQARTVEVVVEQDREGLHLIVRDDGQGFVPERQKGVGLLGMEERVRHLRGEFLVQSQPGAGTTLTVSLPRASM